MTGYQEISPTAFGANSLWLNLGLWKGPFDASDSQSYVDANRALALRIQRLAHTEGVSTIVDLGCGRGASLALWEELGYSRILGVNLSRAEYLQASTLSRTASSSRLHDGKQDTHIQVFYQDAFDFLSRPLQREEFVAVSVDSIYHFGPNRIDFLDQVWKSGAKKFACSDILLSDKWAREAYRLDFITNHLRRLTIKFISIASGVSLANLEYGSSEFVNDIQDAGKFNLVSYECVTNDVFKPFSHYCFQRAKHFPWLSSERWTLLFTGIFMNWMAWMEAVDFVLYALEPR